MTYLDPKADLTFKRVFGEHKHLVKSLLNALLPFEGPEEEIVTLDYLPSEMAPDTPLRKNSIVDVRCKDGRGRQFIVEMQMVWSREFKRRVLFNASKAYVRQLGRGGTYELLQPVYSLNLVNEVFEPEMEQYYHYYHLVHNERTDKVIDGLHLVFVELPKFTPQTYGERKMQVLWLRYLTEIDERTQEVPQELLDNPDTRDALTQLRESAFSEAELSGYDDFWDAIRVERTLVNSVERRYKEGWEEGREDGRKEGIKEGREEGIKEGREEGMKEGREKGMKEGREEGIKEGRKEGMKEGREKGEREKQAEIARRLKGMGVAVDVIAGGTGLSVEEIERL